MCAFSYVRIFRFFSYDLDFYPMTLIYEYDLDIANMYKLAKNEVSRSRLLKVRARTGQTDRHTDATERIAIRIRSTTWLSPNEHQSVAGWLADRRQASIDKSIIMA